MSKSSKRTRRARGFARQHAHSATRAAHRLRSCRLPARRKSPRCRPRPPRSAQCPCTLCAARQRPAKRPTAAAPGALRAVALSRARRTRRVRTQARRAPGCGVQLAYRSPPQAPRTGPTPAPTASRTATQLAGAKRSSGERRAVTQRTGNNAPRNSLALPRPHGRSAARGGSMGAAGAAARWFTFEFAVYYLARRFRRCLQHFASVSRRRCSPRR